MKKMQKRKIKGVNLLNLPFILDVSDGIINYFLVDAALAEKIKGEGHLADVIKPQYGDETQGE